MDGTLVDSVDLHARAWQETLAEFGHIVAFDAIRAQIGKGGDQLLPVFLPPEELTRIEKKISTRRSALFKDRYLGLVKGFPHVRDLFLRILQDGKAIALASSAAGDELSAYKTKAQIADLVDEETSKDDAEKSKPHPDIFAAVLRKLHLRPADVVVVGDTHYDIEAAGALGIDAIGLLCGGFPEGVLRAAGAVAIYRDPADLLAEYASSPLA